MATPPFALFMPILPWFLAALSIVCLLSAALLWVWQRGRPKVKPLPNYWAINARPVFNTEERRVHRHLRDALPHCVILSKLPLVRFTQSADPSQVRYWFDLMGSTSVSFAVCSPNGRVLLAIDLDGERPPTSRSLQIKHAVLDACKLRYLRCAADQLPSVPELLLIAPPPPAGVHGAATDSSDFGKLSTGPNPSRSPAAVTPAVAQARSDLANTVASRRRERSTLWQDSGFMHESFFDADNSGQPASPSGFGALGASGTARVGGGLAPLPEDVGGIVIDTPVSPLRH
jgi:Protein of unknown function (DUF2726)